MPADNEPGDLTLIRTFADAMGEYRCTAIAMGAGTTGKWASMVVGAFVGIDGQTEDFERREYPEKRCPTQLDLGDAIDAYLVANLGKRRAELEETSDLMRQVNTILMDSAGPLGYLLGDPGLSVTETLQSACHVARVLTMGEPGQVWKMTSALIHFACGARPEPPPDWLESPVGAIAARIGIVEKPCAIGVPMSATDAAKRLGEAAGKGAVVQLLNDGLLREHPDGGVDSESVRELIEARARQWSDPECDRQPPPEEA